MRSSRGTLPEKYRTSILRFDSLEDFHFTHTSGGIRNSYFESESLRWFGGESEQVALNRCLTGDLSLLPTIHDEFSRYHRLQQLEIQTRQWVASPYGAYPQVGDFLAGAPDPMRRVNHLEVDTTGIRLVVNTVSSAGVSSEHLRKRGLVIAAFARALSAIRPLELFTLCAVDGYQDGATCITVRLPTQPMNLSQVAWALSSSGFTRGLNYGMAKVANGFSGGWPWGEYDHHRMTDRLREFLQLAPQDVYIPPINLNDAMLTNPYEWLDTMLDRYLPQQERSHV